jgi:hypothetical protein
VKKPKQEDATTRADRTMKALDAAKRAQAKAVADLVRLRGKAEGAHVALLRAHASHTEAMFADIDKAIERMKTAGGQAPSAEG